METEGSSPRVRGSPKVDKVGLKKAGIIPAGAGLTGQLSDSQKFIRDHPRGCGAHQSRKSNSEKNRGSSPRVRGSHADDVAADKVAGIIPAGAGLTPAFDRLPRLGRDHPRGCGAHPISVAMRLMQLGSSPRVRGSRIAIAGVTGIHGIIPAGAGLTLHARGKNCL